MPGNKNDREKRKPSEIKFSNRKLMEDENTIFNKTNEDNNTQNNSSNQWSNSNSNDTNGSWNIPSSGGSNVNFNLVASIISGLIGFVGGGGLRRNDGNNRSNSGCMGCGCLIVIIIFVLAVAGFFLFSGSNINLNTGSNTGNFSVTETESTNNTFSNSNQTSKKDYSWLLENAEPREKKPYTIMVYMNGADLESKHGLASRDLVEMVSSNFDSNNINLLVLTGGSKKWKEQGLSSNLTIYNAVDGHLLKLADLGMNTMADKNLLSKYVDFSVKNFPAEKYGFIFWNHGGGTIYGYGYDENFNGAGLSILEISEAFSSTYLNDKGFEFIGYDCCLMATLETAKLMSPYARYFIASAELEPGTGWDYNFLRTLSDNPNYNGAQIGKDIVDLYIASNDGGKTEATLSVVDLQTLQNVVDSFDNLATAAESSIISGRYNTISKARRDTKAFGYQSEDFGYDLVDIKHLAQNLREVFPNEANKLISDLSESVVYNKATSIVKNSNGLTTYIPYIDKQNANKGVDFYKSLNVFPKFTVFLDSYSKKLTSNKVTRSEIMNSEPSYSSDGEIAIKLNTETLNEINEINFVLWKQLEEGSDYFVRLGIESGVDILDDGTITTTFDGYWTEINNQTACLYEIERFDGVSKYAVPAVLNGEDVNIIVIYDDENPEGKVLYAIQEFFSQSSVAPKNNIEIKTGDKIKLKYRAQLFLENENDVSKYNELEKWVYGNEFIVDGAMNISIEPVDDKQYMYGFWIQDNQKNSYYTKFIEIKF